MFSRRKLGPAPVRFWVSGPVLHHGRSLYPVAILVDTDADGSRLSHLDARTYEVFDTLKEAQSFVRSMNAKGLTTESPEWRGE